MQWNGRSNDDGDDDDHGQDDDDNSTTSHITLIDIETQSLTKHIAKTVRLRAFRRHGIKKHTFHDHRKVSVNPEMFDRTTEKAAREDEIGRKSDTNTLTTMMMMMAITLKKFNTLY